MAAQKKSLGPDLTAAAEKNRTFGAGFVLGEPSGLTAKYWLDEKQAVVGGLAFSFGNFFELTVDYLYHFPGAFGHATPFASQLTPYVGGGAVLLFSSSNTITVNRLYFQSTNGTVGFGLRIPLGIEWRVPTIPLGVFLEFSPGLGLVPATYAIFQGGIGARYYFF